MYSLTIVCRVNQWKRWCSFFSSDWGEMLTLGVCVWSQVYDIICTCIWLQLKHVCCPMIFLAAMTMQYKLFFLCVYHGLHSWLFLLYFRMNMRLMLPLSIGFISESEVFTVLFTPVNQGLFPTWLWNNLYVKSERGPRQICTFYFFISMSINKIHFTLPVHFPQSLVKSYFHLNQIWLIYRIFATKDGWAVSIAFLLLKN